MSNNSTRLVDRLAFANEQRDLLEPVVGLYLAMGKTKLATDWIGDVSYVFGPKAVRGLAAKPELKALAKNKSFLKVAGKDAAKTFLASHLAESVRMFRVLKSGGRLDGRNAGPTPAFRRLRGLGRPRRAAGS